MSNQSTAHSGFRRYKLGLGSCRRMHKAKTQKVFEGTPSLPSVKVPRPLSKFAPSPPPPPPPPTLPLLPRRLLPPLLAVDSREEGPGEFESQEKTRRM